MRWVVFPAAVAAALALLGVPTASGTRSSPFSLGRLQPEASFKDGNLRSARPLAAAQRESWGGPTTASDGETVNVTFSDTYPVDPARLQQTVDFLTELYHGTELSTVSFYIAPLAEVQSLCGRGTGGCFGRGQIISTGDTLPDGSSAANVLVHEYGHQVAANRENPPWTAIDWGPKRWSTAAQICPRQLAGTAFPGNESADYRLNPGEAWAETYRLLNFQKQAWPDWVPTAWRVVDQSFYPTAAQLDAAKTDVLQPWAGPQVRTIGGRLRNAAAPGHRANWRLRFSLSTPLDGDVTVRLQRAPAGATMSVATRSGKVLSAGVRRVLETTVCGPRSLVVTVRARKPGTFVTSVSTP